MRHTHPLILSAIAILSLSHIPTATAQDEVMLQGFYWDGYSDSRWTKLEKQADELARYFDLIWVPNSGFCSNSNNMGYMPLYYWDQNSSFGTEAELRSMISSFKQRGLGTVADIVINHHNTEGWFTFPAETYKGETYQLLPTDICHNDDGGATLQQATKDGVSLSANNDTGTDWSGCRDLDHKSANVQKVINAYLSYLINDIGYTGFRYDMVKGYSPSYTAAYNTAAQPSFSVGEYWDNSTNIKTWINGTKVDGIPTSSAFDFQFRYRVRDAIAQGNWRLLAANPSDTGGYPLVYQSDYRPYAVTFIENHDTERRPNDVQDPIKADTLAANAYMLAMPGTPCVFLKHWQKAKSDIKRMISARRLAGITNVSTYTQLAATQGYYAVQTTGTRGSLICVVGSTPSAYQAPTGYTKVCSAKDYTYYLDTASAKGWDAIEQQIQQEAEDAKQEEENFVPHTATVYVKADFTPVYFYAWTGNNQQLNGAWPGKLMTGQTTLINGETWYRQTFSIDKADYYINIIFNQGNGKPQTADITEITTDKYFTATISNGKVIYTDVTPTVAVTSPNAQQRPSADTIYDLQGRPSHMPGASHIVIKHNRKYLHNK